jgi:hypothetical protein
MAVFTGYAVGAETQLFPAAGKKAGKRKKTLENVGTTPERFRVQAAQRGTGARSHGGGAKQNATFSPGAGKNAGKRKKWRHDNLHHA